MSAIPAGKRARDRETGTFGLIAFAVDEKSISKITIRNNDSVDFGNALILADLVWSKSETDCLDDANCDGAIDANDIDAVATAIRNNSNDTNFDLNYDEVVNNEDIDFLVRNVLNTYYGDTNLDGQIGFSDFLELAANFGHAGGWQQGDFDGDVEVNFGDFLSLATSFGTTAASKYDRVVTLGDSYSSGLGIHRHEWSYDDQGPAMHSFDPSTSLGVSTCKRELQTATGPMLAAELGVPSIMTACGGAEIWNIQNQLDAANIPGTGAGTLVSITIGGNDIRNTSGDTWPELVKTCIKKLKKCHTNHTIDNFGTIQNRIAELYTNIGKQYPDITIRVLAYPQIMQRSPGCSVPGVSRSEADWIDRQIDVLNSHISAGVTTAGKNTGIDIQFVSVKNQFDDHGACRFWQSDRYVNGLIFGGKVERTLDNGVVKTTIKFPVTKLKDAVSGASFHPNQRGHDAFLSALRPTVRPAGLEIRTRFPNSDGTWRSASQRLGDRSAVLSNPVLVGDYNADGRDDLAFMFDSGAGGLEVRTKFSNGNGTWSAVSQQLGDGSGVLSNPVLVGDYNADGRDDLVFTFLAS